MVNNDLTLQLMLGRNDIATPQNLALLLCPSPMSQTINHFASNRLLNENLTRIIQALFNTGTLRKASLLYTHHKAPHSFTVSGRDMATQIWFNFSPDNVFVSDDTKSIPKPMLTSH